MDKGRRTSSIIEKFVYDTSSQELNVSFQDLQYNIENGEMGFFEKDGDICYLSKLEIASSGDKPFTASFSNGDIFGSATIDGALGFIENGGGGGGSATILIEVDPDNSVTGITPEELKKALQAGVPIACVKTYQQQGTKFTNYYPAVFVGYATGEYQEQIMHQMSLTLFEGADVLCADYLWSAEDNAWLADGGGGD